MTRLTAVSFVILNSIVIDGSLFYDKRASLGLGLAKFGFFWQCAMYVYNTYLFIYVSIYSFSYWEYCTCSKILSWQPTPNRQQALVKKFDATEKIFVRVEVLIFLMEREGLHNHIPLTSLVCATGWMTADSKSNCNYIKLHV